MAKLVAVLLTTRCNVNHDGSKSLANFKALSNRLALGGSEWREAALQVAVVINEVQLEGRSVDVWLSGRLLTFRCENHHRLIRYSERRREHQHENGNFGL